MLKKTAISFVIIAALLGVFFLGTLAFIMFPNHPSGNYIPNSVFYISSDKAKIYYVHDGPMVTGYLELSGVDTESFKPLPDPTYTTTSYGADKNNVYRYHKIIYPDASPEYFVVLNNNYVITKNKSSGEKMLLFADAILNYTPMSIKDINTFEVIDDYGKDSESIYYRNEVISSRPMHFREFDRPGYYTDDKHIYTIDQTGTGSKKLNATTFQFLPAKPTPQADYFNDYIYIKDKEQVLFNKRIIEQADPKTFVFICHGNLEKHQFRMYAKDKNFIYAQGRILDNVTLDDFNTADYCAE